MTERDQHDHDRPGSAGSARAFGVVLAVAIGVSLVGFLVGTRPAPVPALPLQITPAAEAAAAVPSQPYLALRLRRFGPNSEITSDLDALRRDFPKVTDPVRQTEADRAAAVAARAARRAFAGAPPIIPHLADEQGTAVCLACHERGIRLAGRTAPVVSHPQLTSCTQCHVAAPGGPVRTPSAVAVASAFVGRGEAGKGQRAWQGAPPVIPHSMHMREQCASCHGVTGPQGLRTTHPERRSCVQCHAPARDVLPWSATR